MGNRGGLLDLDHVFRAPRFFEEVSFVKSMGAVDATELRGVFVSPPRCEVFRRLGRELLPVGLRGFVRQSFCQCHGCVHRIPPLLVLGGAAHDDVLDEVDEEASGRRHQEEETRSGGCHRDEKASRQCLKNNFFFHEI